MTETTQPPHAAAVPSVDAARAAAIRALTAPGQPLELAMRTVLGVDQLVFVHAPRSLRQIYEEAASDRPFLSYQDEHWTFAQAWAEAGRIGQILVDDCGVKPGDRVAIAMRNYPQWTLGLMAATSVGAVAVAMNAHWKSEEMAYALSDSGARVLLADQERLDRLDGGVVPAGLRVYGVRAARRPAGVPDLAEAVAARASAEMPALDIAPDELACLLYTSGSTGHPKGVPSTHRMVISALLSWELDRQIGERTSGLPVAPPPEAPGTLLAVPLFHVTGLHASLLSSFRLQRRMVCMYRWDPQEAARLIDHYRLSSVVAPAAMTGDLVRVARSGAHDLGSLLAVGGGGAPRAPAQVHAIAESFRQAAPSIGWGMTEPTAIGTTTVGADYLQRPESSGRCSCVLQIRVVDESGRELPSGGRGELQIRGTSVFRGYWRRPDADAESFVDGWFRTGDLAWIDADGFVYIVDRIKDLIIRGGENIGCGAVEAALLRHPDVREVSVYAVPDERLGEEVGATVHAASDLDPDDLRSFVSRHLAAFEVPRYLLMTRDPLPRTASGKLLKRELRAQALVQLAQSNARQ